MILPDLLAHGFKLVIVAPPPDERRPNEVATRRAPAIDFGERFTRWA
jgi:hypothetical protein